MDVFLYCKNKSFLVTFAFHGKTPSTKIICTNSYCNNHVGVGIWKICVNVQEISF